MKEDIEDLEAEPLDAEKGSDENKSSIFFISGIALALITIIVKLTGPREFMGIENEAGYYGIIFFAGILIALLLISVSIYLSGVLKTKREIEPPTEEHVKVAEDEESFGTKTSKYKK